MPTLLPNPCPPPSAWVEVLTAALVWEHDEARSTMARLEFELAVDQEAKHHRCDGQGVLVEGCRGKGGMPDGQGHGHGAKGLQGPTTDCEGCYLFQAP